MAASHISQNASMILARYVGRIEKEVEAMEKRNKDLFERGIISKSDYEETCRGYNSIKTIANDLFECAEENTLSI